MVVAEPRKLGPEVPPAGGALTELGGDRGGDPSETKATMGLR